MSNPLDAGAVVSTCPHCVGTLRGHRGDSVYCNGCQRNVVIPLVDPSPPPLPSSVPSPHPPPPPPVPIPEYRHGEPISLPPGTGSVPLGAVFQPRSAPCSNPTCPGTVHGTVGQKVSCPVCGAQAIIPPPSSGSRHGSDKGPPPESMGDAAPPPPECEHPPHKIVKQKRTVKDSGCCGGCCCPEVRVVHKCTACGKVAPRPKILTERNRNYAAIMDAQKKKEEGKALSTNEKALLVGAGVMAGAGCVLLYKRWDDDRPELFNQEDVVNGCTGGTVCGGRGWKGRGGCGGG